MPDRPSHAILYDAGCGFCRWSLGWVLRWDRGRVLRPVPLQSPEALALLPGLAPQARMASWHLVDGTRRPDDRRAHGVTGALPPPVAYPGLQVVSASRETRTSAAKRGRRFLPAVLLAAIGFAAPSAQAAFPAERLHGSPAEIRAYWTDERMREAVPASQLLEGVQPPSAPLPASELGAPSLVAPSGPARPATRSGPLDGLLGGDGRTRRATEVDDPRPSPLRTHGKVYFTLPDGIPLTPDDYVCSGTSIKAENKRLVVTAGHCVYGLDRFASRWLFVPAKDGDEEPFGRWTARRLMTTPQWRQNEDIRYDVGMARMAKRNGRRLEKVVGARGIGFNIDPNRYHAYGYPAEDPFPGDRLYLCDSPAQGSDQSERRPRPRRIDCDMTGGSSGGGWVVRERLVNSVVSYGYECTVPVFPCNNPEEGKLFGPYFGETIKQLYRSAQRRARR